MGLFNKAREAFSQVTQEISKGADYLSLQTQLGGLTTEMDRQLVEVGRRTWELSKTGGIQDPQLDVLLKRVNELDAKMMELRAQIQESQNASAAPAPPAPPTAPAPPTIPTAPAAEALKCSACGVELAPGTKFCGECGAKVGE